MGNIDCCRSPLPKQEVAIAPQPQMIWSCHIVCLNEHAWVPAPTKQPDETMEITTPTLSVVQPHQRSGLLSYMSDWQLQRMGHYLLFPFGCIDARSYIIDIVLIPLVYSHYWQPVIGTTHFMGLYLGRKTEMAGRGIQALRNNNLYWNSYEHNNSW